MARRLRLAACAVNVRMHEDKSRRRVIARYGDEPQRRIRASCAEID